MSSQLLVKPEEEYQSNVAITQDRIFVPCVSLVAPQRPLFSQSFVELSSNDRKRKRWTAASSFTVQALVVAFLVVLPLWLTDSLPLQQLNTFLIAPPPPPPPHPPAAPMVKAKVVSQIVNGQLLAPNRIPKEVKMIKEEEAPPPMQMGVQGGVVGGVPGGQVNGVLGSLLTAANTSAPVVASPKRLRVSSGISEGLLLKKIEPVYPIIAQRAHIQGSVQLKAIISREGTIENLQLVSGHPTLVPAAMEAVRQWRYRPYILNGEPLEVETTVFVNFHFSL